MRTNFLDLLACPGCGSSLTLFSDVSDEDHVMEGCLQCDDCDTRYPIVRGVPRLLPAEQLRSFVRENTAKRFAYEWNKFSDFDLTEERVSLVTWFAPRKLSDLSRLTVLDCGCGMGRHATIAASHGVERVVGIDLGDAVEAAFSNTRHLNSVCIVQGDIYHPPVRDQAFDAAYSVGVLHHLPDPGTGFAALAPKVKVGGWFQVWLYGREGNGWIVYGLNPIRTITSRMPLPLLKALSMVVAAPLAVAARTIYRLPGASRVLPYAGYIRWMSGFTLRKIHAIVFDQLLAPVAHYMSRHDVERMADVPGWAVTGIEHSRGMSWGVCVERQAMEGSTPSVRSDIQRSCAF